MPKKIVLNDINGWDPDKEEFVNIKGQTLILEHSLVSLQKWESKWQKPYISDKPKTPEEMIDYIKCMCMTPNVDERIFYYLPPKVVDEIAEYIDAPMTATTFSKNAPGIGGASKEVVTAEIIYYWMISLNIPMEFRKWHLNQLITLIKVCQIKNAPNKKMGKQELAARNKALNAQRRAKLHTHG